MNGDSPNTPVPPVQPGDQWQYKPESNSAGSVTDPADFQPVRHPEIPDEISWTASEFVAHHKSASWYGLFIVAVTAVVIVMYLITKDWISVIGIAAMAVIFGIAAGRKPRTLNYHLDMNGMTIGPKFYPYSEFKFFSVIEEGAFSSLAFTPMKRFIPPLSVYYDPKDEEAIIEVVSRHLPLQEGNNDAIDKFARHIRF